MLLHKTFEILSIVMQFGERNTWNSVTIRFVKRRSMSISSSHFKTIFRRALPAFTDFAKHYFRLLHFINEQVYCSHKESSQRLGELRNFHWVYESELVVPVLTVCHLLRFFLALILRVLYFWKLTFSSFHCWKNFFNGSHCTDEGSVCHPWGMEAFACI